MWTLSSAKATSFGLLLAGNIVSSIHAFTVPTTSFIVHHNNLSQKNLLHSRNDSDNRQRSLSTSLSVFDGLNDIPAITESTGIVLSDMGKMGEALKSVLIVLFLGGGLIPAAIAANKSMITTITGGKKEDVVTDAATSLDPTAASAKTYISSSGATGPILPNSGLIFATEDIPLADIIAITGRMTDVNSIAKWADLPSAKMENIGDTENPPMWLPRATFKANIRAAKFQSWPVDPETNLPVGGEELKKAEEQRIRKNGALIGDAALDAVFDTWAWGSGIATPDKVAIQLDEWKVGNTLDLGKLTNAAIRGRATTGFAAFTFIVIQVIAYGTLFIAPALRFFFDIDIGFGQLGDCSENGCRSLF